MYVEWRIGSTHNSDASIDAHRGGGGMKQHPPGKFLNNLLIKMQYNGSTHNSDAGGPGFDSQMALLGLSSPFFQTTDLKINSVTCNL